MNLNKLNHTFFKVNSLPFKTTFLMFFLMITSFCFSALAQKVDPNKQNDTQNQQGQNQSISPVDPNEPQLEDGKTIEEGRKMKEDYQVWKMYVMEEEKSSRDALIVNYDSLYNAFKAANKQICNTGNEPVVFVPAKYAFELNKVEPKLYSKIQLKNKYFGTVNLQPLENNSNAQAKLAELKPKFQNSYFTNKELIGEILPPIALTNKKPVNETIYTAQLMEYFATYPDLIYYCNKGFAKMIVRKQFFKIMELQLATFNVVELPTQEIKTDNKQSK